MTVRVASGLVDPQRFEESLGGCIGQRYQSALEALPDVVKGVDTRTPVPRLGRPLAFLLTVRGANLTIAERDQLVSAFEELRTSAQTPAFYEGATDEVCGVHAQQGERAGQAAVEDRLER